MPEGEPPQDLWAQILADVEKAKPYLASQLRTKARPALVEEGHLALWLPDTSLKTPEDLAQELKSALKQIYAADWSVEATNKQVKTETLAETETRMKEEAVVAAASHPEVRKVLNLFEGASVADVSTPKPTPQEGNGK